MKKVILGIQVARAILAGDISLARTLAGSRKTWSVSEGRAICGVCRLVQTKGWNVHPGEFGLSVK